MKKINMVILLLSIIISSCSKQEIEPPQSVKKNTYHVTGVSLKYTRDTLPIPNWSEYHRGLRDSSVFYNDRDITDSSLVNFINWNKQPEGKKWLSWVGCPLPFPDFPKFELEKIYYIIRKN